MSNTPEESTTQEQYTEQQEARRQALIAEDVAMHEETDEASPFPGESADADEPEVPTQTKKAKKASIARPITRPS